MALLVDRMVDEREAVIKPLGPLLEKQRRYSGALQLGDGRLALLLNPSMLIQLGRGDGAHRADTGSKCAAPRPVAGRR
jgi:two-component system chemotaxis sensor kinase CheA